MPGYCIYNLQVNKGTFLHVERRFCLFVAVNKCLKSHKPKKNHMRFEDHTGKRLVDTARGLEKSGKNTDM